VDPFTLLLDCNDAKQYSQGHSYARFMWQSFKKVEIFRLWHGENRDKKAAATPGGYNPDDMDM
jgi:hypothetical protein